MRCRLAIGARLSTIFPWISTVFSWISTIFVDLLYKLLRSTLLLRAAQPVFLHAVTQLLRVHTQQRGGTMHAIDPPVGRLQGR